MMKFNNFMKALCLLIFLSFKGSIVHATEQERSFKRKDCKQTLQYFAENAEHNAVHTITKNKHDDNRADVATEKDGKITTQEYYYDENILPIGSSSIKIHKGCGPDKGETWLRLLKAKKLADKVTFSTTKKQNSHTEAVATVTYDVYPRKALDGMRQEVLPRSLALGLGLGILGCVGMALKSNKKLYAGAAICGGVSLAIIGLGLSWMRNALKKCMNPLNLKQRPAFVVVRDDRKIAKRQEPQQQQAREWSSLQYLYGQDETTPTAGWYVYLGVKVERLTKQALNS